MEWGKEETVFVGIDKIDLQSQDKDRAVAGSILYGPSITGGEAFFVPRHSDPTLCDGELLDCRRLDSRAGSHSPLYLCWVCK